MELVLTDMLNLDVDIFPLNVLYFEALSYFAAHMATATLKRFQCVS